MRDERKQFVVNGIRLTEDFGIDSLTFLCILALRQNLWVENDKRVISGPPLRLDRGVSPLAPLPLASALNGGAKG